MAKKGKVSRVGFHTTDVEIDKFLSSLGISVNEEFQCFTGPLHKAYVELEHIVSTPCTEQFQLPKVKGTVKLSFKSEADFNKSVLDYFQREVSSRILKEIVSHPGWDAAKCVEKLQKQYYEIFKQCLVYAFEEVKHDILMQKIYYGMNPFSQENFFE